MTVDDVPEGSANLRTFEMMLIAAVEVRCIEIVVAEKYYGSGLELIGYLEKLCVEVELQQVFK